MSTREPREGELNRIYSSTVIALKKHFGKLLGEQVEEKSVKDGYNRFKYEIELANIFYRVQYDGIKICQATASSKLTALENEYYTKLQDLRDDFSFKGGVFDTPYIVEYLSENSEFYSLFQSSHDVRAYLEGFHNVDIVASKLHELRKMRLTLSSLLKAVGSKSERIHPNFDPIGTVTGRILVTEPLLQHVRKVDRDFILPDAGFELLYLDYKEFEPRIIASLSGDPVLLSLLQKGGLYEELASTVFNNMINRSQAKIVMMQLMYYASVDSISNYIASCSGTQESTVKPIVEGLVSSLQVLRQWQQGVVETASLNRTVMEAGLLPRYFKKEIPFTNKMGRQAINHLVQGTGAIILKNAIQEITQHDGTAKIVLPMHDALRLQVSTQASNTEVQEMIEILNRSFNRVLGCQLGMAVTKTFY